MDHHCRLKVALMQLWNLVEPHNYTVTLKTAEPFLEFCYPRSCSPLLHLYLWFLLSISSCWCWTSVSKAFGNLNLYPIMLADPPSSESSLGFMSVHSSLSTRLVMKILHSSSAWLDPLSSALPVRYETLDNYALRTMLSGSHFIMIASSSCFLSWIFRECHVERCQS